MAEKERTHRRRRSASGNGAGAEDAVEQSGGEDARAQEPAEDSARHAATGATQAQESAGDMGATTVTSELKKVVREAAIETLSPVARKATTSAARYAVTKGPKLVGGKVVPKVTDAVSQAGGPGELAKKAGSGAGGLLSKVAGDDKGGAPSGTGRGRRLPVQESVDVAVPLETAYNQFTQFEQFPEFMYRVERVEQRSDTELTWHENIWGVRRQWDAQITDQRPNERIAWEATSGSPKQKGVVTFHALSDRLTRIEINLDQQPKGVFEKTSSGFRVTRRALRSDLMRFKAFVETRDEETGAWRSEIEEGEVVGDEEGSSQEESRTSGERGRRSRRRKSEPEPEPELDAEEADEEEPPEDEPEAEADLLEEEEDDSEEEEAPPRKPVRKRSVTRRRSPASPTRGR